MSKTDLVASLLLGLVLFVLAVNGCGTKSPPEPGRYYHEDNGFSIRFPEGWAIEKSTGQEESVVEAASPWENDADMFREFIVIDTDELPNGISLEDYFDELNSNTENDLAHYQEEDRGNMTIDNTDAKWIVITYTVAEGAMQTMSYLLVKERKAYIISCTSEPHKFHTYRSQFEKAAESFRFQ